MTLYNLYIFDRTGTCLFYEQWHRRRPAANLQQEQKLVFGLMFILKQFTHKLSPKQPYVIMLYVSRFDRCEGFQRFTTSSYKLHFLETPSGLRLVATTDTSVADLKNVLQHIYGTLYVEYVLKSPAYQPGGPITTQGFATAVNAYVGTLPFFS